LQITLRVGRQRGKCRDDERKRTRRRSNNIHSSSTHRHFSPPAFSPNMRLATTAENTERLRTYRHNFGKIRRAKSGRVS
jgi:hypothetical protein